MCFSIVLSAYSLDNYMDHVNDTQTFIDDPQLAFADLLNYNQMANLDFKSLSDKYD